MCSLLPSQFAPTARACARYGRGLRPRVKEPGRVCEPASLRANGATKIFFAVSLVRIYTQMHMRESNQHKPISLISFANTTMSSNKLQLHAHAVNLARRFSVQNENDLMQVRPDPKIRLLKARSISLPMTRSPLCLPFSSRHESFRRIFTVRTKDATRRGTFRREFSRRAIDAEDTLDTPLREYDHAYCQELASHLSHMKSLPEQCKQYPDVKADLQRRDTDTTHPTQILS